MLFREQVKSAVMMLIIMTVLTGIIYPLSVTVLAQIFLKHQANGSLIVKNGKVIGSSLIGQNFDDPKYLWGRLSQTSPGYNASASSGSNLGPLNPTLVANAQSRIDALHAADPKNSTKIPVDLVTSSASGLDPHISLASATYQIARIAKARGVSADVVKNIIDKNTTARFGGLIGEPVVNVLMANIALDEVL